MDEYVKRIILIADVNLTVRPTRLKFGRKEVEIYDKEKEDLRVLLFVEID